MDKYCKNCVHFRQHYVLGDRGFFRAYCGHCTFPKARSKRPDAMICENFVFADAKENAFVTKQYLSKEILRYVLSLELLPQIKELKEDD